MFDPRMELVSVELEKTVASPSDAGWARARAAFDAVEDDDEDIAAALAAGDADTLRAVLEDWKAGRRLMLRHDREVLKRAMKAFRKSLKVTRLDEESSLGGGAGGMSSGRHSSIVGIRPPERYPIEVWNELARQKRLVDAGHGLFELPPGG